MKALSLVTTIMLLGVRSIARAQDVYPHTHSIPPAELAKQERVDALCANARQSFAQSNTDAGIRQLREAVQVEATEMWFSAYARAQLARALTKIGEEAEALSEYHKCFRYADNEISTSGPSFNRLAPDYAVLLIKHGQIDQAKALYYAFLRHMSSESWLDEPVPLVVVFDADPNAVVWQCTPNRLQAALLAVKALVSQDDPKVNAMWEQVKGLAPDWFLPLAHLAVQGDPRSWRDNLLQAPALAHGELEETMMEHLLWRIHTYGPSWSRQMEHQGDGPRFGQISHSWKQVATS